VRRRRRKKKKKKEKWYEDPTVVILGVAGLMFLLALVNAGKPKTYDAKYQPEEMVPDIENGLFRDER